MQRWRRALALAAVTTLLFGACSDDDDTVATDDAGEQSDGGAQNGDGLTITAVDYDFTEYPETLEAGPNTVTFENTGEKLHEAALIKVPDGFTEEQFAETFGPVLEGGPIDEDLQAITGIGEIEGGESTTVTFLADEGTYFLVCAISDEPEGGEGGEGAPEGEGGEGGEGGEEAPADDDTTEGGEGAGDSGEDSAPAHYTLGMLKSVEVSSGDAGELPDTGASITAADYSFEADVPAGQQTVSFTNTGPDQIHHAVVFGFPEGVDEAGAEAAFDAFAQAEMSGGPPPEGTPEPEEVGGSFVYSPGLGGTFEAEFESGRTYAVLCFIQDRAGGPPHAFAYNMRTFFTVA